MGSLGYISHNSTTVPINVTSYIEIGQRVLAQEAQLSQRDRATLRVIEYFAKSLKVTRGHSK